MNTQQLDEARTLFSILILIDGRVFPEELTVMGNQIITLQKLVNSEGRHTPDSCTHWFHENQKDLQSLLQGETFKEDIKKLVACFSDLDLELKIKLRDAMIRIAHADGEYHETERLLIKFASEEWNIKRPTFPPG